MGGGGLRRDLLPGAFRVPGRSVPFRRVGDVVLLLFAFTVLLLTFLPQAMSSPSSSEPAMDECSLVGSSPARGVMVKCWVLAVSPRGRRTAILAL